MKLPALLLAAAALALAGCAPETTHTGAPSATGESASMSSDHSDDPFLWLEDTRGERALEWVRERNRRSADAFASGPEFETLRERVLEVLDSDARIPWVNRRGEWLYNYWRDAEHPRGVWRRTTLAEYRKDAPAWETVLDVDALGEAEGRKWVWKGAQCLKPDYRRCLVSLSPDGGDAVEVREFDAVDKRFVDDGFFLPAAKTDVSWIDADTLFVATDFGPGSMTSSSYPRIVKRWQRGTPLASARTIHEGREDDLAVGAWHDRTPGWERSFVSVALDFWRSELYLLRGDELVRVEVPDDAVASAHREWLLVETRSEWDTGGNTWPAGALLAIRFDAFMDGARDFTALFTPDAHSALSTWSWTRNHLILNTLRDVQSRLEVLTPADSGAWARTDLAGAPSLSTIRVAATDPDHSDEYWLDSSGFLAPATLQRGVLGTDTLETLKQEPEFFAADRFTASQHFATSKDGTRVPYFEIAPRDLAADGTNRTLLYGYGGFEVSLLPRYSGSIGRAWLERGGVYVIANIRGGGEYGPRWHQAALKANRHRAYEDFAAVARDLVRRGITRPEHLGAEGGSNGGLLTGNMLTSYPELFGAIVVEVPLLDMRRYIYLDAGTSWIGEYGDPEKPEEWEWIRGFSPYHLVKPGQDYPPVLFYTTTSDDRVGPAQARKMAARMEQMGYRNAWFYENLEGGHGGGADNKESAHMHAMAWEFLWRQLGAE